MEDCPFDCDLCKVGADCSHCVQCGYAWAEANFNTAELTFQEELVKLINKHNLERHSNTPDFILADYLANCLHLFNKTVFNRDNLSVRQSMIDELEQVKKAVS